MEKQPKPTLVRAVRMALAHTMCARDELMMEYRRAAAETETKAQ
jgi:hypothetical protein